MILYKYVSFEGGMAIINNSSIGFSSPKDFNDPFEMSAFKYEDEERRGLEDIAVPMHIPAHPEHGFWFNVNMHSG